MILFICYSRKMTKGLANRLFIALAFLSLFSAVADLGMEVLSNSAPMSELICVFCSIFTYLYLTLRNANLVLLLLFLLALTRTTFLLRKMWAKIAFILPYLVILVLLIQNLFTHNAFTVTAEEGYARGPLMYAFYAIALLYGIVGFAYCIYCRRFLSTDKWIALLSVYILNHLAVLVQFLRPGLLLEMFCTAMGELMIMLSIMRPEERMDIEVGMLSWASYQYDLKNIIRSKEHVNILAIRIQNFREIRNYLGEHNYNKHISKIADGIRSIKWKHQYRVELYYERPDTIYLITDADEPGLKEAGQNLLSEAGRHMKHQADMGVRFEPQICQIRCPDDLHSVDEIISLGHNFQMHDKRNQNVFYADEIIHSQSFVIETHIDEILDRAVRQDHIEMYYQPIYDVRSGCFRSAEALARIIDPEYGLISPAIFIPSAETKGFIIQIGDIVLDQVFRFASENDLDTLGISCIEINLSVAQCMEQSLPEKIGALQQKYGIDPSRINFEITETTFENISDYMIENINRLIRMGYSFALDDYGIGYSSIQRISQIPLQFIKLDKSMIDALSSDSGKVVLNHTVQMMQSIGKQLIAEGAETAETVEILKNMNCDYIQGYYFSRPLPSAEFIRFIEDQKKVR